MPFLSDGFNRADRLSRGRDRLLSSLDCVGEMAATNKVKTGVGRGWGAG